MSVYSLPPIYWINLDRSAGRRQRMLARLEERALRHERIPAVDGSDPSALAAAIRYEGVTPGVAAAAASHLTAIARAFESGAEEALVLEDDMTFELLDAAPAAWVDLARRLPTDYGAVRLCVAETPRCLDALYDRSDALVPIDKIYWCAGAYVVDRVGMRAVLDAFGRAPPFDVRGFVGEHSPEHLILGTLVGAATVAGPFDARVPLFVYEALDSDIHPEEMPQYRRARSFILEHHSALLADRYVSPYPLASFFRRLRRGLIGA